jgi:hypothetical protein
MKLSKLLLTIGLVTSFTAFGEKTSHPKEEISAQLSFETIVGSFFTTLPRISTPTELKTTYSDVHFTEFSLEFLSTRPSSTYIWVLMRKDALVHIIPFNTDEKGFMTYSSENSEGFKTVLLDEVSRGETFPSILLDGTHNTISFDLITPFPLTYPIGQTGSLSLRTKFPYPFISAEAEGLIPGEKLSIEFDETLEELTADKNGKISADLFVEIPIENESVEFTLTASEGKQTLLFEQEKNGTKYKAKINL